MTKDLTIKNPMEWTLAAFDNVVLGPTGEHQTAKPVPAPAKIETEDLMLALRAGWADFLACRSDVIFLCLMYPIAGAVLARFASGRGMLELAFPLICGFALVAPVLATGLYEVSRQKEAGQEVNWTTAFEAWRSPAIGSIMVFGAMLLAIFAGWLASAEWLYNMTLGYHAPATLSAFTAMVMLTAPGQLMAISGIAIGFVFALAVLAIAPITIPLMLDRHVGVVTAVSTSVRAAWTNKWVMLQWGMIIATGLALGSLPFLVGLALVVPVLGHASWHLYRALIRD